MPTQAPKEMHGGHSSAGPAEPSEMTRLEQMRDRLATLSDEARQIRAQMPREFEPDVERIQQQMQLLGERLSELSGGFVYQMALPKPGRREASSHAQAMPRTPSDEGVRVRRASDDEVIALGAPVKSDNPWSEETARALTRFYESGEAFLGSVREAAHAAVNAAEDMVDQHRDHANVSSVEPTWLDQRLAEIATRIEQSLAAIKPDSSLLKLGQRFDQLETRVGSALDGMITRADLKELHLAEAQIEEIGAQLDQLRRQYARLDAIDAHLGTLAAQLSDDRLTRLFASGMGSNRDTARLEAISSQLATIAGQLSHERLADLISQNAVRGADLEEMATAAAQKAAARFADREARETQGRDINEVRGLLESLINERRHSDENNASMLETMQQAIIRVLDRIDALELAQQEASGLQQSTYAPVSMHPSEPETEHVAETTQPVHVADEPEYQEDIPPHVRAAAHEDIEEAPAQHGMFTSPPFDLDAAFATDRDSAPSNYMMPTGPGQQVDALRHDFIADAHRAKLKAASKVDSKLDPHLGRAGEMPAAERNQMRQPRKGRGFFRSPRVMMSILTILAMIPAALFFMPRTPVHDRALPAAADLAMPTIDKAPTATAPSAPESTAPAAVPQDGEDSAPPAQVAPPGAPPAPSKQSQRMVPDAQPGDLLDAGAPAAAPEPKTRGMDSASLAPAASAKEARLAFLQGNQIAPKPTPAALMEQHVIGQEGLTGDTAAVAEAPPQLPPATVGPYSLRLAAARGNAAAQFEVASRIAEGKRTDKDMEEAARWYQRSAASGFAMSQFRIGNMYERGNGVSKDIARAKIWYSRAAEQGNLKAMHNLAVLIASRSGPAPDYAAAVKWFSQAAAFGLADSQYNLAMLYENGLGVQKDSKQAYKWLVLAAKSGDAEAKKRRDVLKASLNATDVGEATAEADTWQAKRSNPLVNDSRVAGQAWLRTRVNNG
jgi:localization factor PodJL